MQVKFLQYDFESGLWDTSASYLEMEGLLNVVKIDTCRRKKVLLFISEALSIHIFHFRPKVFLLDSP